jgi:hypothetical protein
MMSTSKGLKYAGFGLLGVAAVFLFTYLVMLLWNALVPELFNGPVLGYWQTMGVFILAKILFSGIGGGGHKGEKSSHVRKYRSHEDFPRSKWRQKYEAKMNGKVEGSSSEEKDESDSGRD